MAKDKNFKTYEPPVWLRGKQRAFLVLGEITQEDTPGSTEWKRLPAVGCQFSISPYGDTFQYLHDAPGATIDITTINNLVKQGKLKDLNPEVKEVTPAKDSV